MAGKRIRHNLLTYPRQEPLVMNQAYNVNRESVEISATPIRASRIGLGTWALVRS
jgi:hypothetical protein